MELIPGLPYDIGLECLFRVPYDWFSSVESVCRRWKLETSLPEFWKHRKAAGLSQQVVVMVQARVDPNRKPRSSKCFRTPVYRLTVCNPATGIWSELPPVPFYSDGLPLFCQVVAVGLNLVVMGGWDPMTWEVSNAVFVYNFSSATWTRGADMPGCPRSFFACASNEDNAAVLVAGGHDQDKRALGSAMMYDVDRDMWVPLPDMATERDECKGVFHGGKFHVIGGYDTEMQGRFGNSAEALEVGTLKWDPVQHDFLMANKCPRTCTIGGDGKFYMSLDGDVASLETPKWQIMTQLPARMWNTAQMTAWQNKLFVIGSSGCGEPHNAYVLDLESYKWTRVEAPVEFSGHVQSCCWLNI